MKALSPEQVLSVADEVCAATGAHIINYPALSCYASLTNPHFQSVPLFSDATARHQALAELTTSFPALDSHNELFCSLLHTVLVSRETKAL